MQLSLLERPRIGFGPLEYNPYNVINDDLTLNFLVDAHGTISKLFYDWINTIVNFQGSRGQSELNKSVITGDHQLGAFEVGYKDSYTTTIKVHVYDKFDQRTASTSFDAPGSTFAKDSDLHGRKVMTLTAYNAFPKQLPTNDMSWQNENELMRMAIPFTFTDYNIEYFRNKNSFEATVNNPERENARFQSVRNKKVIEPNIPDEGSTDIADIDLANTTPSEARQQVNDIASRKLRDPALPSAERSAFQTIKRDTSSLLGSGRKI